MNTILRKYNQASRIPFGRYIFSYMAARMAPYSRSVKPQVKVLKDSFIICTMRNRRSVRNHLNGVYATAICTLCEFSAGLCMEASIPRELRWIPTDMHIAYVKMGMSDLEATCDLGAVAWHSSQVYCCEVSVRDRENNLVALARINMKVSRKKSLT